MAIALKRNNTERHFLPFSRRLFLSVISLFLVFAASFLTYQYQREKEYKVELLDTKLQDYNERLFAELDGLDETQWNGVLQRYTVNNKFPQYKDKQLSFKCFFMVLLAY